MRHYLCIFVPLATQIANANGPSRPSRAPPRSSVTYIDINNFIFLFPCAAVPLILNATIVSAERRQWHRGTDGRFGGSIHRRSSAHRFSALEWKNIFYSVEKKSESWKRKIDLSSSFCCRSERQRIDQNVFLESLQRERFD